MERSKWVEGEEEEEFDPRPSQVGLGGGGIFCRPVGDWVGWLVGPSPHKLASERKGKSYNLRRIECVLSLSLPLS